MTTAEVVIVGGGVEGTAAAWALAARGVRDVVLCERGGIGSGMSGLSSGIVRCHYGVRSLAAMAWRGVQVFAHDEELLGATTGYRRTGYVVGVTEGDVEALRANVALQQSVGVDVSLVGASDVQALWPSARLDDFAAFAYEPYGGYGDGHQTANAFAVAARRCGAAVEQGTTVTELLTAPGSGGSGGSRVTGVRLADGSTIAAPTVVVAAGWWSAALLRPVLGPWGVDLPIRVQREEVLMFAAGPERGPVPVFSDLSSLQYLRPEGAQGLLWGNSDMSRAEWLDAVDGFSNAVGWRCVDDAVERFSARFPGLDDVRLTHSYAGCYDVTPDYNPVISRTPVDGLVVAAGFSGHGYKIAPAVGELVADLVLDGASRDPNVRPADFRLARFAEGDLLRSENPYAGAGSMR